MAEREIRYCASDDGVSIGYSVTGTGVPLLFSFPIGHQILMVENPVLRPWFEGLADAINWSGSIREETGCRSGT